MWRASLRSRASLPLRPQAPCSLSRSAHAPLQRRDAHPERSDGSIRTSPHVSVTRAVADALVTPTMIGKENGRVRFLNESRFKVSRDRLTNGAECAHSRYCP